MLSKFSVKRPVTVVVAIIIVMILGVVSVMNTGVDLLPEMNIPYLVIVTVYPGAAPEVVEKDITDPIEKSLGTVSSVKQFSSTSSEHYSMIVLELNGDADVNVTANDINDKLKLVSLPKNDMIQAPIIMKLNPSMLPVMQISIGKKNQNIKDSTEYLKKIIDRINAVEGVAAITASGLVQNMALVMLDTAKTGDTVMEFFTDLFGIDLTLSANQKQEIKQELIRLLEIADKNPEISNNGKVDPILFLDKLLIPYIEKLDVGDEGIGAIIKDTVVTQLKTQNSAVRKEIVKNLTTLLENRFILANGDKNNQIYSDMLDGISKNIVRSVLNENLGGLTNSITYDLFQQLIFAQDFEMPAGSLTLGATNYIVKVGDQLTSRDDLYNLPMVSMNLSENIKDYLSQIKTILSVVSLVNGDKATITETQINAVAEALAFAGIKVDDYPQWIIDSLIINQPGFNLNEEAKTLWKAILTEGLKDTILSFDTRVPYNWRTILLNEVKSKNLFIPNGTIIGDNGETWNETLKNTYILRLEAVANTYQPMDYLLSSLEKQLGEDSFYALLNSISNRTPEQNISTINAMFKFIGRIGGEGSVIENLDNNGKFISYTVDFAVLYKAIDSLGDRLLLRINLSSMANISFLDDAAKQITTLLTSQNGVLIPSSAVQISIEKEPSKSTADVTNDVKALLKKIANEDVDFTYTVLSDDGEYINFMLSTVATNLLLGALLAIIILILFLKDIKATFTVGFSIVISVVLTFVLMYFSKITLNIVSMGGLALGVGMLVDNSIVVLENIYRLKAQGKSIYKAAIQGAKQVTSAIIASTLTTVIVFLPIAFIEGLTKQIFTDMALTICFSLLASLISALTIVPMAVTTIVKKPPKQDGKIMKNVKKKYISMLNFSLNHRWIASLVVLVLLGSSVAMALSMDSQLFPDMSSNTFTINVSYNSVAINNKNLGISSDSDDYYTYDKAVFDSVAILKSTLSDFKDVETVGISKSGGMTIAGMTLGGGSVSATVTLKDEKKRDLSVEEFEEDILAVLNSDKVSQGLFTFTTSSTDMLSMAGMSSGGSIDILLYGDDIDQMRDQSVFVASEMEKLKGIVKVDTGISASQKEYKIAIDKKKANAYGLTVAQVYLQVAEQLKTPDIAHTLRLDSPITSSKQDVSVTIYPNTFNTKTWYLADNGNSDAIKIFFQNNTESIADYYIVNEEEKSLYVKTITQGKEVIILSQKGDKIPLNRNGNDFYYEYAVNNSQTSEVSYVKKSFTLKDGVEYSQAYQPSIDLVTLPINSINMQNPNAATITVPLYKLLKDESFEQDEKGNIIYRAATDTNLDSIPLNIRMVDGYSSINHIQGRKCITLTIHYGENVKEKNVINSVENYINEFNKTTNSVMLTTDTGDSPVSSVMNTLYLILIFAVILIYLIMVAQFQSWKSPFIILSTIPLAFTGSLILLFITGMKLSAMALVGLILLMGIVVNNGIVFVDYANKLIEQGVPKRQALLRTGLDRFRPILMTAFTTIVAMLIMALDGSSGGQMLQPLAIATLGGLFYATLLTLIFVPIVFDFLNKKIKLKDRVKALKEKDIDQFDAEDVTDSIDNETSQFIEDIAALPKEKITFKRKK